MNMLIEYFNKASVIWWTWASQATVQGTILLGLVLLVLALWRRATPTLCYSILILVLIKFLFPAVVSSSMGLFAWLPMGDLDKDTFQQTVTTVVQREGLANVAIEHPVAATSAFRGKASSPRLSIISWALMIQCLGSMVFFVFIAFQACSLRKQLRACQQLEEGPLFIRADKIARRMGLRRLPYIFLSSKVTSPQSGGLTRSFVILPEWTETLDADEGDILIAHELVHVQRRDGLANWFQAVAQALLWWNPIVWWLNARIRTERELCCDDMVLAHGVAEGERYSRMLVNVAERLSSKLPALTVISMADSFRQIDRRVRRALDPQRKRSLNMSYFSIVGLLVIAGCVLPGAHNGTGVETAPESQQTDTHQIDNEDVADDPAPRMTFQATDGAEVSVKGYFLKPAATKRYATDEDEQKVVKFILSSTREGFKDIHISADREEPAESGSSTTFTGKVRVLHGRFRIASEQAVINLSDGKVEFFETEIYDIDEDSRITAKTVVLNLDDTRLRADGVDVETLTFEKIVHVRIKTLFVEIDRDANFSLQGLLNDVERKEEISIALVEDFEHVLAEVTELESQDKAATIARPELKAILGTQCNLTIGSDVPYKKSGNTEFVFIGVKMDVIARAVWSPDNSFFEITTSVKVTSQDGWKDFQPIVNKRESEITTRMRYGQTVCTIQPALEKENRLLVAFLTVELLDSSG